MLKYLKYLNFWKIYLFYVDHLTKMIYPFQPILKSADVLDKVRRQAYRWHYVPPVTLLSIIIVDSLIMLYHYGNPPDAPNPYLFNHMFMYFMPPMYIKRSDINFASLFTYVLLINLFCLLDNFPHKDFIILQREKEFPYRLTMPYRRRELADIEEDLGEKLVKFDRKFQFRTKATVVFLAYQVHIAFIIPYTVLQVHKMFTTNFEYIPSLRFIVFGFAIPLYFRYFVGAIHVGLQFMGMNRVLQIKQQHYYGVMQLGDKYRGNANRIRRGYYTWRRIIAKIFDVTREVEYYNRFYSKYITTTIVLFMFSFVMISSAAIADSDKAPILQAMPWVVYSFFLGYKLVFLNSASSRTIYWNIRLFKRLRQFQIQLLQGRSLNRLQTVKLELVNEYKLLMQKCSFKLLNSAAINNKLFAFQIFGYVSVFYMKVLTD